MYVNVLFGLLLIEIISRLWLRFIADPERHRQFALYKDVKNVLYSSHPYLSYYLTPDYRDSLTSHNSLGYRGKEIESVKAAGIYRIALLGGSTTYDTSIKDNDKTFAAQLEKILRDKYGYARLEVINAGVGAYTSWESLVNLEFRVLDLDPDLVVVYHAMNDVKTRLVAPSAYRSDNSGYRKNWEDPGIRLWEYSCFLRILSRMARITRQVNANDFTRVPASIWVHNCADPMGHLRDNPPKYFIRNLQNMVAVSRENRAQIMFSTFAYNKVKKTYGDKTEIYYQGVDEHNEVLRRFAADHHVALLDFAAVMPGDEKYYTDMCHLNESGCLEKAEIFAAYIEDNFLNKGS